jgi:ankyrin repeat protein
LLTALTTLLVSGTHLEVVAEKAAMRKEREPPRTALLTAYFIPFAAETYSAVAPERIRQAGTPLSITSRSVANEITRLLESRTSSTSVPSFDRAKTRLLVEWTNGRRIYVDQEGVVLEGRSPARYLLRPAFQQLSVLLSDEKDKWEAADAAARERARPALVKAIAAEDFARAERLLAAGADPNRADTPDHDKTTPLMYAAYHGNNRLCTLLLKHGARLNAKDDDGCTTATHAVMGGHRSTFELLIARGASMKGSAGGEALYWAAWSANDGQRAMVKRLLELGADVNYRKENEENKTPLFNAISREDIAVATMLLDHGAHVDAQDSFERSPLTWACIRGDNAMARLLLARGASVNMADGFALRLAIRNKRVSTIRLLLEHGAEVSASLREEARRTRNKEVMALLGVDR